MLERWKTTIMVRLAGSGDELRCAEIFLASRRAGITPGQVGLPVYDAAKRRVPAARLSLCSKRMAEMQEWRLCRRRSLAT